MERLAANNVRERMSDRRGNNGAVYYVDERGEG